MLITIGGVSRAGKTTLAHLLRHLLGIRRCAVLSQDDYPQPEYLIPKIRDVTDWELPESISWVSYERDAKALLQRYEIVIAEGLFLNRSLELPPASMHLQVEIDKEIFVDRRKEENRWGPEEPWYRDHVWTNHLLYGMAEQDAWRIEGDKPFPLGAIIQRILLSTRAKMPSS